MTIHSFDQILARVTIRDILVDAGHHPVRSRMACPLHDGSNKTSFAFTDSTFYCHSCNTSGGLIDLARYLFGYNKQESLRYLCRNAGVLYEEAAEQSLATFRRDSDPPDVSENILQVRQALQDAKELVKRLPEPEPDELWEAKNQLEWLKLYHVALNAYVRTIKKAVKLKKMEPAHYQAMRDWLIAESEEWDDPLNYQTWLIHQLEQASPLEKKSER